MDLVCMTWNIFHGRDAPPEPTLGRLRARLTGATERGETHLQISRDLSAEFHDFLADARWDICMLQECPPRWRRSLERACGASSVISRTARNWLAPLSGAAASRRPDLIASWEGGSNLILARGNAGGIIGETSITLTRWPEKRTLALARLDPGIAIGSLHLSTDRSRAAAESLLAANAAIGWAGERPLVLGGDFNLRPGVDRTYETLAGMGLEGAIPDSIDQLLVSDLEAGPARRWEDAQREVVIDDLALRLSDHAPVSRTLHLD